MKNNKTRLLQLLSALQGTDETHPLTARQIVRKMYLRNIEVAIPTIREDIAALRDMGYDIPICEDKRRGYYLSSHALEDYELKLLCDMTADASFLTEKDSMRIIEKLKTFASPSARESVQRMLCMDGERKTKNVQAKFVIDGVMHAIGSRRRISFYYLEEDGTIRKRKETEKQNENRCYIAYPYCLAYQWQAYYLLCVLEGRNAPTCFRVDRIVHLTLLNEDQQQRSKSPFQDISALRLYLRQAVHMYSGESCTLALHCREGVLGALHRQFGQDIHLRKEKDGWFLAEFRCNESDGMYRWLMGHADEITVMEPICVREKLSQMLIRAVKKYTCADGINNFDMH